MSEIGEKIAAEVNRLAAENPDYIYDTPDEDMGQCVYFHNGEPSCLYGYAMRNLGLIDARIEGWTMVNRSNRLVKVNYQTVDDVLDYLGLPVDKSEAQAFVAGQDAQDNSRPWDVAARVMNEMLAS